MLFCAKLSIKAYNNSVIVDMNSELWLNSDGGGLIAFYLLELRGIIIIFIGFLRSREVFGLYHFPLIHGFKRVSVDYDQSYLSIGWGSPNMAIC